MSNISPETGPKFVIGRNLSPEEEAERIESLEDGRSDNSGGFARSSRVHSGSPISTVPAIEGSKIEPEVDTLSLKQSRLAILAIKSKVDPLRVLIPRTTLEYAVVNEEGDVVTPDAIEDDKDDRDDRDKDFDGGYYEADYRDLARQKAEGTDDINVDNDNHSHPSDKTFLPADDEIGLVGAVEDGQGDVKPDYSDPINGSKAA